MTDEECFHELMYDTLGHADASFLHQHVVDAYTAQHAEPSTKTIAIVFALFGPYLCVEKGFSGRQVQRAHMELARRRRHWDRPNLPAARGAILVAEVAAAPAGPRREALIRQWCASVWDAWRADRPQVVALLKRELDIDEGLGEP